MQAQSGEIDVLFRLRQGTAAEHEAIEKVVPLTRPNLTMDAYVAYLQSCLAFYEPLEKQLAEVPDLSDAILDLELRQKSAMIRSDLDSLGQNSTQPPPAVAMLPDVSSVPKAIGALYVLEGSTLGGQILVRIVRGKLGLSGKGMTFLASYGDQVGMMWKSFGASARAALRTECDQLEAVAAAKSTFTTFRALLEARHPEEEPSLSVRQ